MMRGMLGPKSVEKLSSLTVSFPLYFGVTSMFHTQGRTRGFSSLISYFIFISLGSEEGRSQESMESQYFFVPYFYLILINLNVHSHKWPVASVLDSAILINVG